MEPTPLGTAQTAAPDAHRSQQSSPAARRNNPALISIAVFTVVGAALGGKIGLVAGLVLGLIYLALATVAAAHYPLDLHDGAVLENARAPESFHFTAALARTLGIEPPALYAIALDKPQMCVCAVGFGKRVRGRIGVSKALLREADEERLRALLTLAVARVASGEATILSRGAALAGLPMQLAQAPSINGNPDNPKWHDVESGLSPLGKGLLVLFAPITRTLLSLAGARYSAFRSDAYAMTIPAESVRPETLISSLQWLQDLQLPLVRDPVGEYNPAEAALYLVSPFDTDYTMLRAGAAEMPLWRRSRFLATSVVPSLDVRLQRMRELAPAVSATRQAAEEKSEPPRSDDDDPDGDGGVGSGRPAQDWTAVPSGQV